MWAVGGDGSAAILLRTPPKVDQKDLEGLGVNAAAAAAAATAAAATALPTAS